MIESTHEKAERGKHDSCRKELKLVAIIYIWTKQTQLSQITMFTSTHYVLYVLDDRSFATIYTFINDTV